MAIRNVIQDAFERLDSAEDQLVLDFSPADRIDTAALQALEQLASKAHDHSVNIVLSGVTVEVYKVLKLVNMASRFCFRT